MKGGTIICCLLVLVVEAASAQQRPPVQFETRADLILIDANIVNDDGLPIEDLKAEDFSISIDGAPRTPASVQFVKSAAPPQPAAVARPAHYSSNQGASEGRRIVIVVDENSIPPGGARAVLMSTERLLQGLSPHDRVAFIRLPTFEDSIDFTTDRSRIAGAVKKVIGKAHRVGFARVSLAEAVAHEKRDSFEWDRAIARLCTRMVSDDRELCIQEAEGDASQIINAFRQRARETLNGLGQVIANVRQTPGPKTLLLLSQGFLGYDYRTEISRLADIAAAARVSLYVMQIDLPAMDIADAQPSMTRSDDERLLAEGVDDLAGASRGARFRIVGNADRAFARVARELSGYYLIGLEPTDADRDGKPHRIKVEVKRPSLTVRARSQFTMGSIDAATTRAATPEEQVIGLLRAAAPESGLPLRLAAFTAPSATAGHVRVIVGADVGPPITGALPIHIGLLLIDGNGKVYGNTVGSVTLPAADSDDPQAPRYVGTVEVPPGDYTVRLAVIDPEGHAGSVHHPVAARLKEAGGLSISDLILSVPTSDGSVDPEIDLHLEAPALRTVLELTAADARELNDTRVNFEVADASGGAPLVSARGVIRTVQGPVKPVVATLDVGALPPGSYIARAVVSVSGQQRFTTTRPFEIAPRKAITAAVTPRAAAKPTERAAARATHRARTRAPIPPFSTRDVLAPGVVNPFIDHVLSSYGPSPAAQQALIAIKGGDLQSVASSNRQITDLGMSFAQGLSLLAANRPAEADAYFRAALRSSSDFIGAAFYLGATLAAAGRDRDAVGAWQTALIGDVGAAGIYPVLIDGLLRLGDGDQALQMLAEAEPTFTDRDQYTRRLVQGYALGARYAEALPRAHDYLSRHPDDIDMLFLTMHMMYEADALGTLPQDAGEQQRFRDYAGMYEAANGPQGLIVQGWRKALGIR